MSLQQFSQVDFFECIIAGEAQMPSHSIGGVPQRLWLMSEVSSLLKFAYGLSDFAV